jgi:DHA1 family multidrug resistance protein-like MFS transporter
VDELTNQVWHAEGVSAAASVPIEADGPAPLPRRVMRRGPLAGLPREVAVLAAVAFFVAAGFGIVAPAIPLFARSFGVDRFASSAVISAFALMRFVSALGVGRMVNAWGARVVLGIGIAVVAGSSALAGLAQNYAELIALRGVGGVGSAMFGVSAISVLLSVTTSAERGRAVGSFSGGFLLGGISGPALGGLITEWSLRAPFFIYAGTLAAAGGTGLLLLPRHIRASGPTEGADATLTIAQAIRMPAFRAAALTNLADNWASLGVRAAIVPLFVVESLHRSPLVTGIGFTVFTVANGFALWIAGRLADRRGRRPVLIVGCLGSAAGCAVLILPGSLPVFMVAMVVFGLGSGMLDVAPGAMLGDVVGSKGGTVIAAYQMAGDAGSLAGPLVAGALADSIGFEAAFASTAIVLVAAAGVALQAPETLVRAEPSAAEQTAA